MWTAAKVVLFACWALVLAFFLASLGERFAPVTGSSPDNFAAAVLGLAAGIFPCLWLAFRRVAPREYNAAELPEKPAVALGVRCPTCQAEMTLQGEYPDLVANHGGGIYIWRCGNLHWWRRVGVNAADATFPWRVLTASAISDSLSPKVYFG